MQRHSRFIAFLSAMSGVVALFLRFAEAYSPISGLLSYGQPLFDFSLFAAPGFLAIPITAWQLRRLVSTRPSRMEIGLAYILSGAAMCAVIWITVRERHRLGWEGEFLAGAALAWTCVLANMLVLALNLATKRPCEVSAEVFLMGGYLPDAMLCLVYFARFGLGPGAFMVGMSCMGYLYSIGVLLRSPSK